MASELMILTIISQESIFGETFIAAGGICKTQNPKLQEINVLIQENRNFGKRKNC